MTNYQTFQFHNPDPKALSASMKNLEKYKATSLHDLFLNLIDRINQHSFILFDKDIDPTIRKRLEQTLDLKELAEKDNCIIFIAFIYAHFRNISQIFAGNGTFVKLVKRLARYGFLSATQIDEIINENIVGDKKTSSTYYDNTVILTPEYGWLSHFYINYPSLKGKKYLKETIIYLPPYLRCEAVDYVSLFTPATEELIKDSLPEHPHIYRNDDQLNDLCEYLTYLEPEAKHDLKTKKPTKGFLRNLYDSACIRPFFFEEDKTETEMLSGHLLMAYIRNSMHKGKNPFILSSFLQSVSTFYDFNTNPFLASALLPGLKGISVSVAENLMFAILWKAIIKIFLIAGESDGWVNVPAITEYMLSSDIVSPSTALLFPPSILLSDTLKWKDTNMMIKPEEYYDKLLRQWTSYLILMLSTAGIMEVAFDSNLIEDDISQLSKGAAMLRYARLTKAGYFALGKVPKLVLPQQSYSSRFELDTNHHLVRILPDGKVLRHLIMQMGPEIYPDVFKVDPVFIAAQTQSKEKVEILLKNFRERILNDKVDPEWQRIFDEVINKFTRFTASQLTYIKVTVKNPDRDVERLISSNPEIKKYSIPGAGNTLFVPITQIQNLRDLLKDNDYYM